MYIKDRIYGEVKIDEDVIVAIINSEDFQRLKGVDQAGYFDVYFPGTKHSRFEHSVGCYILLKKFGASLEEQIAGLIHDLSHTAFSHTADYVFREGSEAKHNYQDNIFEDFVKTTEISHILEKYGYDIAYILNEENFPLQENDLPDICADRIDYSLRGMCIYMNIEQKEIKYFLDHLLAKEGQWFFDTYEVAMRYAELFKDLNDVYYANKETAAMFYNTAQWLLHAIEHQYIKHADVFTTDVTVINKINKHLSKDADLCMKWQKMNDPHIILGQNGEEGVVEVVVKSRVIDPFFYEKGHIMRVSEKNDKWKDVVRKGLEPKMHYLKTV
ncbi:MAG: hypothetical protein CR972_03445 [Candidatus Moraniibacteriota bacterium]|nr:MAG: hypothetical protein CR972_03445 [Candidatus Moranbacteria bacterium]